MSTLPTRGRASAHRTSRTTMRSRRGSNRARASYFPIGMIGLCALTMAAIVTVQIGVLQLHSEQGALKSKLIQMRQDTDALRGKIDRTSDAAKLDKAAVDLGFERIPVQAYRLVPRG